MDINKIYIDDYRQLITPEKYAEFPLKMNKNLYQNAVNIIY